MNTQTSVTNESAVAIESKMNCLSQTFSIRIIEKESKKERKSDIYLREEQSVLSA